MLVVGLHDFSSGSLHCLCFHRRFRVTGFRLSREMAAGFFRSMTFQLFIIFSFFFIVGYFIFLYSSGFILDYFFFNFSFFLNREFLLFRFSGFVFLLRFASLRIFQIHFASSCLLFLNLDLSKTIISHLFRCQTKINEKKTRNNTIRNSGKRIRGMSAPNNRGITDFPLLIIEMRHDLL